MRDLSGVDSMFLALESRTNLFQVGAVSVLDPATAPDGAPAPHAALQQVLAGRLDRLGPMRRRLVPVPGDVDNPRWVEGEPDLDRHVRRGALPAPGSERELAAYAADVLARPLDRDRPLWEIHVVEGLDGGLVAGVAKLHHSIIDGVGGAELTAQLMDLTPEVPAASPSPARGAEPAPGAVAMLAAAARHGPGRALQAGRVTLRMTSRALALRRRNRRPGSVHPPAPFAGPRTSLCAPVGPERSVGMVQVDRADVEAVREATGVTVNDVVLYLAGSALREHLARRDELPERPLVAFVPRSTRGPATSLEEGVNSLSGMLASLATDVADPLARLLTLAESAAAAKDQERVLGEDLLADLAGLVPPAVLSRVGGLTRAAGLTTRRPPFSVVVSSFPGSPVPLYCAGAELVAYYPFGPVIDGAALNITASSYRDRIGFGMLACRDAFPPGDMDALGRHLVESMGELVKTVTAPGAPRGRRPQSRRGGP
ncbi:MAG: wax ester/triacylglycerol synthase family O-acyltransferase [Acidobacteriota bacterium]|nr:wax ester/triacylglycerol synthase family O-acyltransferase [Acidobacteriota bacterium]